jgi:molecular chaperone HtpG
MQSTDLYKEATRTRLDNSKIYQKLVENCLKKDDNGCDGLVTLVHEAVDYCYERSKMVVMHMGEYTLHDGEHLFRVLRLMELLIPQSTLDKLSNPELALLILTAFFHDIGMAPSVAEVRSWQGLWKGASPTQEEAAEYQKYQNFRAGYPLQVAEVSNLQSQGRHSQADLVEKHLISDYIRETHARRITSVLQADWAGRIKYKDLNLAHVLVALCKSHNDNVAKLREMDAAMVAGNGNFICVPFIGAMLRLADILDFDGNRTPKVLFAHLSVRNPISIQEWQKHRSIESWTMPSTPGDKIIFTAVCTHPAIQSAILQFCDYIDYELSGCTNVLAHLHSVARNPFPDYYRIPLPNSVERSRISAEVDLDGEPLYLYRDTKFTLKKEQVIDILMGTKLYGQASAALRELIQNSIDTCKLRQKMEQSWGNTGYTPLIQIRFFKEGNLSYLEVEDNGVGMDQDIIDKYYSKVGQSYYKSSDFSTLNTGLSSSFIPTSRFGIGILSYFMITDSIEVETKRVYEAHNSALPISLSVSGQESIFYTKKGSRNAPGTTTRLQLKNDNSWARSAGEHIIKYVIETIPFPPFSVSIKAYGVEYNHEPRTSSNVLFDSDTDSDWLADNDNMRDFRIEFNGNEGIEGACIASIFEHNGTPITELEGSPKVVQIEKEAFTIQSKSHIEFNRVYRNSQSVEWNENAGAVSIKPIGMAPRSSRSKVALHGVAIPTSIFSEWVGGSHRDGMVRWPMCFLVDINISAPLDLNLNSARTEILKDSKWSFFEEKFLTLVLKNIKQNVTSEYWNEYKKTISAYSTYGTSYDIFKTIMHAV